MEKWIFLGSQVLLTASGQLNAEIYATALSDVRYILENFDEDMDFFNTWIEKGIISRLSDVADKAFIQLTYTDAINLLLKANKRFEFPSHCCRWLLPDRDLYRVSNCIW
ncbi:hypothetical protein Dimus_033873 [Dionaea muscipula]